MSPSSSPFRRTSPRRSLRLARAAFAPWAFAFCALALGAFAAAPAQAAAPQVKTQVPGWYRVTVGAFEVTALHDGQIDIDSKLLRNATPQQVRELLARMFRGDPTSTAVNAYLVNTGEKLVLVDVGTSKVLGATLGHVIPNLQAAGYAPEQVDLVLLTHLHADHVGGVLGPDGKPAFPNAEIHVAKREAGFWLDPKVMAKAPKEAQGFFKLAQDAMAPYQAAGRVRLFEGAHEPVPGIRAVASAGHTPGHTSWMLESKGERMLVWGDIVHNAAVQFARPNVTIEFDVDPKAAAATRLALYRRAAKEKLLIAAAHLPFPGLGRVRADAQNRYEWVPVDFAPLPAAGSASR